MERIKRFFLDEAATAEATSTVIMIAGVGVMLAAAIVAWYTSLNGFFTAAGGGFAAEGAKIPTGLP